MEFIHSPKEEEKKNTQPLNEKFQLLDYMLFFLLSFNLKATLKALFIQRETIIKYSEQP